MFCEKASLGLRDELEKVREVVKDAEGWTAKELLLMDLDGKGGSQNSRSRVEAPAIAQLSTTPNPSYDETIIKYSLPKSAHTTISIYGITGRKIDTIVDEQLEAGFHTARWCNGKVPAGVYFVRLSAGEVVQTKKLVIMS